MFGSEILDIIVGLVFVYFLLSLVCSAVNEYIASITNKRGKVLVQGIEALLQGSGVIDDFYAHPLVATLVGDKKKLDAFVAREKYVMKSWWPGFRWIYRLYSWLRHHDLRHYRIPSYLPARTFALALLDAAGYNHPANRRVTDPPSGAGAGQPTVPPPPAPAAKAATQGEAADTASGAARPTATTPAGIAAPPAGAAAPAGTQMAAPPVPANPSASADPAGGEPATTGLTPAFRKVLDTLQRDSAVDVAEFSTLEVAARLADANLPPAVRERVGGWVTQGGYEVQKLHDSVEVWFNNGMDRVSGAYKRHTQTMLFAIGLVVAVAVNADTLDLWRRLSTDKALREGLAANAANTFQVIAKARADSGAAAGAGGVLANGMKTVPFDSASQAHAKLLYDTTLAVLNQTQLRLGWNTAEARALGVLARRTPTERIERVDTVRPAGGTGPTKLVTRLKPEWRVEWWPLNWYRTTFWPKLIGLLVTAFALSLGAPFWFDMLNKVVNIRNAGRAPDEKSKSPEATGKRPAELPTK
jgi:hypothetical protein